MSQQNIETVRRMWDAFLAGSFPAEVFAADVEWHIALDNPEGGGEPLRGPAAIGNMLAEGWDTVTDSWLEIDELIDAGDSVVVVWRGGGTGKGSGMAVEWHESHVYVLRDGLVIEVREFRDREAALEGLGLADAG